MRAAGGAAAPAAPAATAGPSGGRRAAAVTPPSRDELMLIDAELREAYTAATLMPEGRSRRGRKTKHDTATRRWIDTIGFPCVELGKKLGQEVHRRDRCVKLLCKYQRGRAAAAPDIGDLKARAVSETGKCDR